MITADWSVVLTCIASNDWYWNISHNSHFMLTGITDINIIFCTHWERRWVCCDRWFETCLHKNKYHTSIQSTYEVSGSITIDLWTQRGLTALQKLLVKGRSMSPKGDWVICLRQPKHSLAGLRTNPVCWVYPGLQLLCYPSSQIRQTHCKDTLKLVGNIYKFKIVSKYLNGLDFCLLFVVIAEP